MSFREAHGSVGKLIRQSEESGQELHTLPRSAFTAAHEKFGADVYDALSPRYSVERREVEGGTGPTAVKEQIALAITSLAPATEARVTSSRSGLLSRTPAVLHRKGLPEHNMRTCEPGPAWGFLPHGCSLLLSFHSEDNMIFAFDSRAAAMAIGCTAKSWTMCCRDTGSRACPRAAGRSTTISRDAVYRLAVASVFTTSWELSSLVRSRSLRVSSR